MQVCRHTHGGHQRGVSAYRTQPVCSIDRTSTGADVTFNVIEMRYARNRVLAKMPCRLERRSCFGERQAWVAAEPAEVAVDATTR